MNKNKFLLSVGSSSQTYLRKVLDGVIVPHSENGWIGHERDASLPFLKGSKVMYVFTDPFEVILSYNRRGFLNHECPHIDNIRGDADYFRSKNNWTLEKFLDNEYDFFGIEQHFYNWYNHKKRDYDIMFIKYEHLKDNFDKVCDWYEVGYEYCDKYEFKKRNSNVSDQKPEILDGLENIFGDFRKKLESLPNIIINP